MVYKRVPKFTSFGFKGHKTSWAADKMSFTNGCCGNHLHNWIEKVNVEESFQSCLKKCDIWYQGNTLLMVPNSKQCNVCITKVSVKYLKKAGKHLRFSVKANFFKAWC